MFVKYCLYVIFSWILINASQDSLTASFVFELQRNNITVRRGYRQDLSCRFDLTSSTKKHWFFQETPSSPPELIRNRRPYKISEGQYPGESRLTLINPRYHNTGYYLYKERWSQGRTFCDIYLNVEYPPRAVCGDRPEAKGPVNLTVEEGHTATLLCAGQGNPIPTLKWFRLEPTEPDTQLLDGPLLTLSQVTRYAAGNYKCRADNGFPPESECTLHLDVRFSPEIEVKEAVVSRSSVTETSIMCRVTANPMPEHIIWTKGNNSTPLREDYRYSLYEDIGMLVSHATKYVILTIRVSEIYEGMSEVFWCGILGTEGHFKKRVQVIVSSPILP